MQSLTFIMSKQTVVVSLKDCICNNQTRCLYKQFSGGLVFVTQAISYGLVITVNTLDVDIGYLY